VAVVAADHPEQARAACAAIAVDYEVLEPLTDPVEALRRGQTFRSQVIRRGDPDAQADVVAEGYYEVGQQDQAPLGPEAGLAVPDGEGGIARWIAPRRLHLDLAQVR